MKKLLLLALAILVIISSGCPKQPQRRRDVTMDLSGVIGAVVITVPTPTPSPTPTPIGLK